MKILDPEITGNGRRPLILNLKIHQSESVSGIVRNLQIRLKLDPDSFLCRLMRTCVMGKHFSYTMELKYLGRVGEQFDDTEKWDRTFKISDSVTLEILNSIIQRILGWDENHLYAFEVKNNHHIFMGFEPSQLVDYQDVKYLSCHVKLKDLKLETNETFFYEYDFGDQHRFSIQITGIENGAEEKKITPPVLLSFNGPNIRQYPDTCRDLFIEFEETLPPQILFNKIEYINYYSCLKLAIRFINQEDYEVLQKWRKSSDKKKWEKAVVILEIFNKAEKSDNLANELKILSEKIERPMNAIKNWIYAFNAFGLPGIYTKKKKRVEIKRKSRIEKRTQGILEIFHHKPTEFGINRSNWTLKTLAKTYQKEYGEKISGSSVARYLKNSEYRIIKARNVLTSPDPEYREKVDYLLNILWSLKNNEELFFIDELGPLRVKSYGGRCYTKKGEMLSTPQNQKLKGSITLSAALSAKNNQVTWIYEKAKNSSAMIDLIEILFNQHQIKSKFFITWDAASWHSSNKLIEWLNNFNSYTQRLGEGPAIEFVPLPSCSQFLNVIEAVFSGMKRAVIHHSNYQSEEDMKFAISRHFQERNAYFKKNPKRAGNKIWDINFFKDYDNIRSGDYREY